MCATEMLRHKHTATVRSHWRHCQLESIVLTSHTKATQLSPLCMRIPIKTVHKTNKTLNIQILFLQCPDWTVKTTEQWHKAHMLSIFCVFFSCKESERKTTYKGSRYNMDGKWFEKVQHVDGMCYRCGESIFQFLSLLLGGSLTSANSLSIFAISASGPRLRKFPFLSCKSQIDW